MTVLQGLAQGFAAADTNIQRHQEAEALQRAREQQAALMRQRQTIGQQAAGGDFTGARTAALSAGDFDLASALGDMDDDAREDALERANGLASVANYLMRLPAEQRGAVLQDQSVRGRLQAYGISDEMIDSVDVTNDQVLGAIAQSALTTKQQIEASQAQQRIGIGQRQATVSERNAAVAEDRADLAQQQFLTEQAQPGGGGGNASGAGGNATEGERKFGTFGRLASSAQSQLVELESVEGFDPTIIPPGAVNAVRGENAQKYTAAKRAFIDAIIRPMTGAAVTDFEFTSAEARYFPQFGDTRATVEFKRRLRQEAIDAVSIGAGRGRYIIEQTLGIPLQEGGTQGPTQAGGQQQQGQSAGSAPPLPPGFVADQ